ncbi:MAG: radical SAM protein [Theionarchaea archaeon]|nr:radical SAM protein [Theionarchaea archaeon]
MLATSPEIEEFFEGAPLLSGSIRVTNRCNLNCLHCYAFHNYEGRELTTGEVISLINAFSDLGSFRIFLTGGEPFLRDDLLSIVEKVNNRIKIYISTNGTLLTDNIIKRLSKLAIGSFQFSIDGIGRTHDELRGHPGIFQKTMACLEKAVKMLGNVGISTVLTRYNQNEVADIIHLAESLGCAFFQLTFLHFSGRATKEQDVSLEEKIRIVNQLKKLNDTLNLTISVAAPPPFAINDEDAFLCTFPYILGVDANGDVAPCDGLLHLKEKVIGNIKEKLLAEIWETSPLLARLRSIGPKQLKGICSQCIMKEFCGGGCRAAAFLAYGDFTSPDPLCQEAFEKGLFPRQYKGGT